MPNILISWFMLNLQMASQSAHTMNPSSGFITEELYAQTRSRNFETSLVGDMDGPLAYGLSLPRDVECCMEEDDLPRSTSSISPANEDIELVEIRREGLADEMLHEGGHVDNA
ncbi:uncharacterized protein FIBRA_09035 [Fibroporia radiculosa]|uniref:Uncharacterized protein n=1 Tax=Fibroporia radiculosa TaxID=599839 RepID=J4ICN9_9APHY|nr:uncharacterized protein FIBRA_09035 [Fibroporia radiculosa]CCM06741.1 predicted protein [Fibroporia radiculosa]